jgi:hypothetical protein
VAHAIVGGHPYRVVLGNRNTKRYLLLRHVSRIWVP